MNSISDLKKVGRNKRGVSLVEVLLATAIIAFACCAIILTFITNLNLSELNRSNTIAIAHLTNLMERIKCTPFGNMLTDYPNGVVDGPVGNRYYTAVGGFSLKNEHMTVTYTNTANDPLEIFVTCTWQDKRGRDYSNALVTMKTR